MVRVCTLPSRLLALSYGADLVYSEEIIDFKLLKCERQVNDVLNTVDFVQSDGLVIFRTCDREKGRVVLQLGTSDTQRALKVAKLVEKDVAAIDINMGCPKEFSLKGGMGAALLDNPDTAKDILTTLVRNLSIPVTCKIRIKTSVEETLEFAKMVESTGIAALGVHGRTRDERNRHKNRNDIIKTISETLAIPVIANGGSKEIKCFEDIQKFKDETGCSSVMLARAAEWNMSIFRLEGRLPTQDIVKAYLKIAVDVENADINCKYCIQQTMHHILDTPIGLKLQHTGTLREICNMFNMADYYDNQIASQAHKKLSMKRHSEESDCMVKKRKLDDGSELIEMPLRFNKNLYNITRSPKTILYEWTCHQHIPAPKYDSTVAEQKFHTIVSVQGKKYASSRTDTSKKWGEQAAAVVCLRILGIDEGRKFMDGRTDPDCTLIVNAANNSLNSCDENKTTENQSEGHDSIVKNATG